MITREFPPHVVGGISYHLSHLYSEIDRMGHDVDVISGSCEESNSAGLLEMIPNSISVWEVPYGSIQGHSIRFSISLLQFLRNFDVGTYDVIFTHTPLPFSLNQPTITKFHDCPQEDRKYLRKDLNPHVRFMESIYNPIRKILTRKALNHTDYAIFNSYICKEYWEKNYNIDNDGCVIHNGVDTDLFFPRDVTSRDFVLFVGNEERKGLSRVVEWAQSSSRPVKIAGTVTEDDLPSNIELVGKLPPKELARLYSEAAATIHPAQFEAFGNIVLESIACGTPVVVSDSCGAAEIVTQPVGAVTTDIDQGLSLVKGASVDDCLDVATKYTWTKVAEKSLKVAQKVIRNHQ